MRTFLRRIANRGWVESFSSTADPYVVQKTSIFVALARMEVYTTSSMTLPSTSNEPSSLDPQRFDRVCSQRYCGTLLWPGSKSNICDRCLARIQVCNVSTNPRDATWACAKTASRVEGALYDPKNFRGVTPVAPAVPGSITCAVCRDFVLWI